MKIALSSGPASRTELETLIVAEMQPANPMPADPLLGYTLDGRYTLEALIGEGGTGRVYRARQKATGRHVAVKLLREELLRDEASVRRFEREARAACRVNHPNAIIVHDCGRTPEGHCYLVTELISGETLRQHLDREGLLPPSRALWIFREILAGVAAAHERGVVHRDLHPGNVFLCRGDHGEERVKVFDFGGARLLDSQNDIDVTGVSRLDLGQLLHSIRYLPPERLQRDRRPDPRGDVYALGLILFELCTGRYPFRAQDPLQVMAMHLREPPPLLSVWAPERGFSPILQGLVASMLAKDPLLRPADAGEVERRLQAAAEREDLITTQAGELVPEPELEMEMVAMAPGDDGEDAETLPIPRAAPEPPSRRSLPRVSAALAPTLPVVSGRPPSGRAMQMDDTIVELEPPGAAPVRAMVPEPPSLPSVPAPPLPRQGLRALVLALVCLLGGAGIVFLGGSLLFRLYQRSQAVPSAPAPQREPPPAPLQP